MLPLEIHIPLNVREEQPIKLKVEEGGGSEYPYYTGETLVTPDPYDPIELETSRKVLLENVVVKEIPHFETSNEKGLTFIVGG